MARGPVAVRRLGGSALVIAALGMQRTLSARRRSAPTRSAYGWRSVLAPRMCCDSSSVRGCGSPWPGSCSGLLISVVASRVMQSLLYDTSPREPLVTAGVATLLIAIAAS